VLGPKLRCTRWLPFVAIAASSAPLLGLLGTVTGIMNTFTLMTVFGTGDVKTLSSGISEALITTEYGLIVAIPSLLLHAFLSRKARGIQDEMEKAAIAFLNQVAKTSARRERRRRGGLGASAMRSTRRSSGSRQEAFAPLGGRVGRSGSPAAGAWRDRDQRARAVRPRRPHLAEAAREGLRLFVQEKIWRRWIDAPEERERADR
jgi:hypothetical protein